MINVQRFPMGRRSFSRTARHYTADDEKGGTGFFRCRRRLACSCILAGSVAACRDASATRPPTKRADHSACTSSSRHSERRGVAWRPCPSQAHVAPRRPAATCAALRSLGNSASSQQPPASSPGACGAVVDPVQHAMPHHRAVDWAHATVSNGSAEHVTDPASHLVGRTLRALQVLEAGEHAFGAADAHVVSPETRAMPRPA
ncbi:hypothetical protein XF_0638 [Xylella fastidiosa 9a5c]|uniref:Uncharacterized protein n=1 Tax=Xylella fastidiosa (strain 9a5c) TaxID=160492 RepID=Q9PFL9_XYLFA|nr:hypothetical protein XF_0638 [Xylella fastidiosa 9a5c]